MLRLLLFVKLVAVAIDVINCYYYVMISDIIIWESSFSFLSY